MDSNNIHIENMTFIPSAKVIKVILIKSFQRPHFTPLIQYWVIFTVSFLSVYKYLSNSKILRSLPIFLLLLYELFRYWSAQKYTFQYTKTRNILNCNHNRSFIVPVRKYSTRHKNGLNQGSGFPPIWSRIIATFCW